jgi:parallel beta helix pectate lyase-like protein
MKRYLAVPCAIAAVMAAIFLSLTPASAQGNSQLRTWVSAEGDDRNLGCTYVQPCRTFAGAESQSLPYGEIVCKDSGDFQQVNIIEPITINCRGVAGAIENFTNGANYPGIQILFDLFPTNTPPQVIIRGLTIQGANTGQDGILITGAGAGSFVNIEDVTITGNNVVSGAGTGTGISDQRTHGLLHVNSTTIQNNAVAGISIGSSNGSRRAVIKNTQVLNSGTGIHIGANSEVAISHSEISDNATAGLAISAATGLVTVDSTTIAHNGFAFQNSGTVRLSNSDVMFNATGWTGTINTFTNNRFTNNGAVGPLVPIGSLSNPTGEQ